MPMRRAWQLRCCQHTNNVTKRIAAGELADSETSVAVQSAKALGKTIQGGQTSCPHMTYTLI
mgnify:CR=1 FL=1